MTNYIGAILTHTGHPLSRHYNHFSGLSLGICHGLDDISVPYVAAAYNLTMIRQYELCNNRGCEMSKKLLEKYPTLSDPGMIDDWVLRQDIQLHPAWIRLTGDVYYSIMVHLVDQHQKGLKLNTFAAAMLKSVDDHHKPGTTPKYLHCKPHETVFSGGVRLGVAHKFAASGNLQLTGANAWGELLEGLSKEIVAGKFNARWSMDDLLNTNLLPDLAPSTMADNMGVLVLSDSYMKYVKSIAGGYLIRQSGGTFGSLAAAVRREKIDLSRFHYIVIHCGFNDCQLPHEEPRKSWKAFEDVIRSEIINRGDTAYTILFSMPFPHPSYCDRIASHLLFIERQVARYSVSVHSWRNGCPFVNADGSLIGQYFDEDRIHLTHRGIRELWLEWANYLFGLEYHRLTLALHPYKDTVTALSVPKRASLSSFRLDSTSSSPDSSNQSTSQRVQRRHHPYGSKEGGKRHN